MCPKNGEAQQKEPQLSIQTPSDTHQAPYLAVYIAYSICVSHLLGVFNGGSS
jgi:hypothetical protein